MEARAGFEPAIKPDLQTGAFDHLATALNKHWHGATESNREPSALEAVALPIAPAPHDLVGCQGIEPRDIPKENGFTVRRSHQCCSQPWC